MVSFLTASTQSLKFSTIHFEHIHAMVQRLASTIAFQPMISFWILQELSGEISSSNYYSSGCMLAFQQRSRLNPINRGIDAAEVCQRDLLTGVLDFVLPQR